jgi:ParB family chromosome partitioning protein
MRFPWHRSSDAQMTLQGIPAPEPAGPARTTAEAGHSRSAAAVDKPSPRPQHSTIHYSGAGKPLRVAVDQIVENPANPRTEFPQSDLDALAQDIALRGILRPIVVAPADGQGRYRIRMGALRWRAAWQAGLAEVPVTIEPRELDVYALLAENLKRCNLSPLNLARVFQELLDQGESNAGIARQLGIDATTVAHHLALLNLPSALDQAMTSGQCTAPRTLYELNKLHDNHPAQVVDFLAGSQPVTREAVACLREKLSALPADAPPRRPRSDRSLAALRQLQAVCDRLDSALTRMTGAGPNAMTESERAALRQRILDMAERLA